MESESKSILDIELISTCVITGFISSLVKSLSISVLYNTFRDVSKSVKKKL